MTYTVGKKIVYIEGLRGMAAVLVVIGHFMVCFLPEFLIGSANPIIQTIATSPLTIFYNASFPFNLFCLLSSYLLSEKFFRTGDYQVLYKAMAKRYFRLMPVVFVAMLAGFVFVKLGFMYNLQAAPYTHSQLAAHYLSEPLIGDVFWQGLVLAYIGNDFDTPLNQIAGTIQYFFQAVFIVSIIIIIFGKTPLRYLAYLVAFLLTINNIYAPIVMGLFLGDIVHTFPKGLEILSKPGLDVLVFALGVFLATYPLDFSARTTIYKFLELPIENSTNVYYTLGGSLMLLTLTRSHFVQRLFSFKGLVALGRMSFAMFVIHWVILTSLASFIFVRLIGSFTYGEATIAAFVGYVPVVLLFSFFITKYVDRVGIALSSWAGMGLDRLLGKHMSI